MGPKRSGEWLLAVQSKTHPAVQSSVAGEHRWQSPAVSMRRQSRPRLSHQSQSSGRFEMRKWSGQISWLRSCHRGDLKVLIDRLIVGGQAVDLADGCLHASIFQEGDQVPQDGGFFPLQTIRKIKIHALAL